MPIGDLYKEEGCTVPKTYTVAGIWTGGGAAANCTKASTDWSKGIASVAYNGATGKYRLTLTDKSAGYQVIEFNAPIARVTGVTNALVAKMVVGSYSRANGTIDFEVCDTAIPTGTDLATTDKIMINIKFVKTSPDV